jgi:hypothetical protein
MSNSPPQVDPWETTVTSKRRLKGHVVCPRYFPEIGILVVESTGCPCESWLRHVVNDETDRLAGMAIQAVSLDGALDDVANVRRTVCLESWS